MAELLKRKHPNLDLFICDIFDATPKDMKHQLEHPLFSLSKKPDMKFRKYHAPNGDFIEFTPSAFGLANIYDKDILVFVISQLMHKINRGEEPNQTVVFNAYDLLIATNKNTGGHDYKILERSLDRLAGTRIKTCLMVGEKEITSSFGMIDKWDIIKEGRDGRMEGLLVKLSDWMYQGVLGTEILTLSKDYFLISSPLEKRIYELCRKHCGNQERWNISIDKLHFKSGSQSLLARFKHALKKICKDKNIPDYNIALKGDLFVVKPKKSLIESIAADHPTLKIQTIENAKKILNGSDDVYGLKEEYFEWCKNKEKPYKGYDAGFIGFCKGRMKNNISEEIQEDMFTWL